MSPYSLRDEDIFMAKNNKQDLSKMHWRDRYEYEAQREAESITTLTETQIISRIERGLLDAYFAIWREAAKKGTVQGSAMPLWRFLQQHPGESWMLHRYHCAAALFEILGVADPSSQSDLRKGVQWDTFGEEARQQALLDLREIIESKMKDSP
jgi:hypothetical protein